MTQSGEVLYSVLTEFGVPVKLVRLIKICLMKPIVDIHFLFRMI
jgi:hypothetical protein